MIKKVLIDKANRTYQFPPDLFSFLPDNDKPSLIKKTELIDLGKFNWNIPFDKDLHISSDSLQKASSGKIQLLKEAISDWIYEQHKIKINPKKEVYIGGGISQILFSTALAYIDPGDLIFVPELGLPLYRKVTTAAGGEPVSYALSSKTDWKPDFKKLFTRVGHVSRLLFLNSPHNPTGYTPTDEEVDQIVNTIREAAEAGNKILVIIDDAYFGLVYKEGVYKESLFAQLANLHRSEERRVGKECRSRWSPYH